MELCSHGGTEHTESFLYLPRASVRILSIYSPCPPCYRESFLCIFAPKQNYNTL